MSRWPKAAPILPHNSPQLPPRGLKMAPRWPQEAPRWPQYGSKMAQDGPKMGSRWAPKSLNSVGEINMFAFEGHLSPKMAPSWPQEAPRWPKMAPRWPQDGPVRQKTYTCACGRSDQDDSKKAPRRLKTTIVTARAHVYAHSRRSPTRERVEKEERKSRHLSTALAPGAPRARGIILFKKHPNRPQRI